MGDNDDASAAMQLEALPHECQLLIFSSLPPDERARCCVVRRSWNALLAHSDFWKVLDVSPVTSVLARPATEALLRGAAARARGALVKLDASGSDHMMVHALPDIAAANAGTLLDVRVHVALRDDGWGPYYSNCLDCRDVEVFLTAAPSVRLLETEVRCMSVTDARRMLRGIPPFQPLRLRQVNVLPHGADAADTAAWMVLIEALAAHASMKDVQLSDAPLDTAPAVLDAFVDAALACRWSRVALSRCYFVPACAPALSRLLRDGDALTTLELRCFDESPVHMLDMPAAALLSAALRANSTLTSLALTSMHIWRDPDAAAELLGALTAHPSVRRLDLQRNDAWHVRAQAGAAVAELIAANAPALEALDLTSSRLEEHGLGRVVDALPSNTHLRELNIWDYGMGMIWWIMFTRRQLLPALNANTSLRKLTITPEFDDDLDDQEVADWRREMRAVEAIVARRAVHAEAAAGA
jgi:hypothetical protein